MVGVDPLAVGTEVRIGHVGRENAQTKGRRYLVEGRIQIRDCGPEGVKAFARGQGHLWHVEYRPGVGWRCSCPAKALCAHLVAVQLVVTAPADERVPPGGFVA